MVLLLNNPYYMKKADDIFNTICFAAIAIAFVIVAIGIYPYIIRLLRGIHAAADSATDLYRNSIKPKQHSVMAKKHSTNEYYINPDDVKIERSELEVSIPEHAISTQLKIVEVNRLHEDMISDINKRRPVTLWGQERLINKMRNQNMRIELIIDQIGLHNAMIGEAVKLEATMQYAPHKIRHELEMMILDDKMTKERKIALFIDEMDEINSRSKFRDMDIKLRSAEHDRFIMETKLSELERKAKINMVLAQTDQERARAALMEAALELFEQGELSEKLQAYLIICVFNPGEKAYVDFNMDEELADILKKDKQYDVEKKKWEAKSTEQDFKHKKDKFERQRKQQKSDE